ncbi:unnamed protein product [Diabrotica balteata]|uniref:Transmembrane protein n=1 Tax=Diabrotica balteata TaxID=107213 RepID=A0A9N9T014_DIABA|nr:unnamed protein product [Diabrotica balteata]
MMSYPEGLIPLKIDNLLFFKLLEHVQLLLLFLHIFLIQWTVQYFMNVITDIQLSSSVLPEHTLMMKKIFVKLHISLIVAPDQLQQQQQHQKQLINYLNYPIFR